MQLADNVKHNLLYIITALLFILLASGTNASGQPGGEIPTVILTP